MPILSLSQSMCVMNSVTKAHLTGVFWMCGINELSWMVFGKGAEKAVEVKVDVEILWWGFNSLDIDKFEFARIELQSILRKCSLDGAESSSTCTCSSLLSLTSSFPFS